MQRTEAPVHPSYCLLTCRCAALSTHASMRNDADALAATASIVMHDPHPPVTSLQALARRAAR
jgi:hypothetical protein